MAFGDHPNIRAFFEQRDMKIDGLVRNRLPDQFQELKVLQEIRLVGWREIARAMALRDLSGRKRAC
jgi:hypothetical protein